MTAIIGPPKCDECGKTCESYWSHNNIDNKTRCDKCAPVTVTVTYSKPQDVRLPLEIYELSG